MASTADSDVEVDKKVAAAANSIQNQSETCCTKPDQSVQDFPQTDAKTSLKDFCKSTIDTSGAENAHVGCSAENSHISCNLSVEGENNVPSDKAFDKENDQEGKVFKKAISMDNPDYVSASGTSSALVTQGVNPTGKRAAGFTEGSCIVSSAVPTAQMSNLPSPDSLSSSQYVGDTSPWLHETLFPETTFITPQTAASSDGVGHPRSTERASTSLPAPTINSDSSGPKTHEKSHPTRRKVLDLRASFPVYLTLFTILFTLTLPCKEKWVFVFFMCLCEIFFIWMGCDACEDIEDIEESEEETYVNVRKWDLFKFKSKHKVRREDLESGRSLLDNENRRTDNKDRRMGCCKCSPKVKVVILTIFSVVFILLLTVHMYSEACATGLQLRGRYC